MNKQDGLEFRQLLQATIPQGITKAALLFSGGTDSLTILWTLLDKGIEVTCYTFRLKQVISRDSKAAKRAARHWGVKQILVAVPHQLAPELSVDVQHVTRLIQSPRKTHVEVMWGYWHLFKRVKEQVVFSGLQADTLYGSSKSMAIKYSKASRQVFASARRKLLSNQGQEGYQQAYKIAAHFNKEFYTPYTDSEIRDFMLRFTWSELNRPKQKMPAVLGFNKEFASIPIYRRNDNMQCGSGVREYMRQLLTLPENSQFKRVQEVYKSYAR